jgi:oxygen-dependent protoporphyrinogen oxidase
MPTTVEQTRARSKRVVVIGGGITGLAAMHRLLERGAETGASFEVMLLEAKSRLGGVIKTIHREGFLIEAGADSFISEKPEAIELARRIGLESHLIETNREHRRSFIVRDGRLRPVPEGFQLMAPSRLWPFVTSDIFSWAGKARMALDLVIPRRTASNGLDESLAHFVRRRFGREAFERLAQPMIGGIYTADPEKLSLRATLPRFLELEREHGSVIRALWKQNREQSAENRSGTSGARYSLFLSFDQGMQMLVDHLAKTISQYEFPNVGSGRPIEPKMQLNTAVDSLAIDRETSPAGAPSKWRIRIDRNQMIEADAVCLAVPAYTAAFLLRNADPQLSALLAKISYASTATINLAYKRADVRHPLDGFGFVVPFIENRSILACTFSSVKFAGRATADSDLLRAFVGGALQPEMFELDEDEMIDSVRADLRDLLGISRPPLFTVIEKWRNSMPQYHLGHLELVAQIENHVRNLSGLALAGNSYRGAGIPDCIRSGEAAAERLLQSFSAESVRSQLLVD